MSDEPINVTDGGFERAVLQADRPVIAVFWAREGPRGGELRRVTEEAARRYGGEVRVARLEAQDAPQAHARYGVETLPQFLFFRGGQLVARARGLPSADALHPWVEYLLGRGRAPVSAPPPPPAHPVAVTDADFDRVVLGAKLPALVDFWAAWCGPCRMVAPIIERLAAEFAGRALVAKLDVDSNPLTAQRYGAMSIPTLLFFQNGREVDRLVGAQPEAVLRARLDRLIAQPQEAR